MKLLQLQSRALKILTVNNLFTKLKKENRTSFCIHCQAYLFKGLKLNTKETKRVNCKIQLTNINETI